MSKPKKITFKAQDRHLYGSSPPVPASKAIPGWFKKLTNGIDPQTRNLSLKGCMPFLDAMKSGYVIPAPCDLVITGWTEGEENHWKADWSVPNEIDGDLIEPHSPEQLGDEPMQATGNAIPLKVRNMFTIITPPGYSCLITPILNDASLAIRGVHFYSGVVDTDVYEQQINLPFAFTDLSGQDVFIAKGTPLVQVFPFKRENWVMDVKEHSLEELRNFAQLMYSSFSGVYKRMFHQSKKYR